MYVQKEGWIANGNSDFFLFYDPATDNARNIEKKRNIKFRAWLKEP